ncbi:glycoside hydrolase 43 family protein [Aquibacillus koreensis]|uniref:Glycoside hydrolase 43 family protein n=1 Tax=Aquibacillus koreensis TaxID=279446 RepID=A0A9X3WN75_9BACI|nr:glycoside hydrolase 43 family protein [Aquibacillus koreensis]MCT2535980.1 glycoside hydrolase 43 family protein [Aquibacillus koreensis]MDC3420436.1 glycoside hydrolase 43 family protein [Aquibacillus koreensis]
MNKTTVTNPLFWADVPDVDVIRVENVFYMVSTSMHSMPGCPIMKSDNLVDWEFVGYLYDTLEDNDGHNLIDNKNIYGQGQWATSLRYHDDKFYVCFSSNDREQFYIYQTNDIEIGKWERTTIEGIYHDPALLFDEGRVFVIYGCGDIRITELTADVKAIKAGGIDQLLLETPKEGIGLRCEGCHAYKMNGYYYLLFIEWPSDGNQRRRQIAYRSKQLLGEYERQVIFDDDMDYQNKGIAQGAIVDTPHGDWYAMLFQDHDAVGRIPYLLPVNWERDWPMIGMNGKAPQTFEIDLPASKHTPLVVSDSFDYEDNKLAWNWQWNHNPDNLRWSVTKRPGYLRLETSQLTNSILQARNTLTQRTEGPNCSGITMMEITNMKPGDHAGLVALQNKFGTVGVEVDENGKAHVTMTVNRGDDTEDVVEKIPYAKNDIHLKVNFNFKDSIDIATFYYSEDGIEWSMIGKELQMKYTLDHFMGYRIGLFNYAKRQSGGHVDFAYFHYEN